MIKRTHELPSQARESIRGGQGRAVAVDILGADEMAGVAAMSVLTLEPGTWIGEHLHTETEEVYLVLDGQGTGSLDGESFAVGPGDAWVVRSGHTHGLRNSPDTPLRFLALLTRSESAL